MKGPQNRAIRVLETLFILLFVAVLGPAFRAEGSAEGVPEGIYVYSGGFTAGSLELKGGRYELRFSDCTHRDQLISKGIYSREGSTLVLKDYGLGGTRQLEILPDGFVNHNSGGFPEEYVQHVRGDGSRVESPRMSSPLGDMFAGSTRA